jgi:prepilin-type N-terminal cleavage/methylation domain-containing protein
MGRRAAKVSMPILVPIKLAKRRGFSLLEILIVLVIMAISTAIILPSTSRMMDQAMSHAVFFEFQRDVSGLRRSANRTGVGVLLVDPARAALNVPGETAILLRAPWRYTLAPDLNIAEGGMCSSATANLIRDDRVVMTLRTAAADCRFTRVPTAEQQIQRSSSQK